MAGCRRLCRKSGAGRDVRQGIGANLACRPHAAPGALHATSPRAGPCRHGRLLQPRLRRRHRATRFPATRGAKRAARRARRRPVPLAGKSGRPGGAPVDHRAERVHRGDPGGDARRRGAQRTRAAAGDHLDHAVRPDAGRRHPVLPAADPAAAAAGADRAGVAGRCSEGAGGPERRPRRHRDHRLLAVAARTLPRLRHRRGRQRVDHHPRARRGQRQDPA
ncbi:hypothetical protein RLIN73S_01409 [Rhodanobacter lindaniclasticus]